MKIIFSFALVALLSAGPLPVFADTDKECPSTHYPCGPGVCCPK